ncbi:MAG: hypothetical protein ACLQVY_08490 [Limisphaerales bacterium]
MKKDIQQIICFTFLAFATLTGAARAATVTVTNADDGVSNIGSPGTFYWAITNCNPGDTIAFNIPGKGPFYLQEPPNGFPLVYQKHNLLIDGYTQPGSSPNTNPITQSNNAVIKIVIDGRNGNDRDMNYTGYDGTLATSDPPIDNTSMANENGGFGDSERALLAIYRSTNVNVRGLGFLSTWNSIYTGGVQKGVCVAHDYGLDTNVLDRLDYTNGSSAYCHVNGCWCGVDPGNPTLTGVFAGPMAMADYRHRDVSGGVRPALPDVGMIVGVAPGSANPRAEFNVFVGYGYVQDSENIRARFSGNFVGVLPDGVTDYNMPALDPSALSTNGFNGFFEWGRFDDTEPMIIGTDGDGVNDADEGNLFGPQALISGQQMNIFDFYSTGRKPYIIAGNRFGIAVDGTVWTNNSFCIFGGLGLDQGTQVRFGSDFNGVSDALEANIVYNNNVFSTMYSPGDNTPSLFQGMSASDVQNGTDAWVSIRGNVFVNNFPSFNPDDPSGTASSFVNWWDNFAPSVSVPTNAIPALSTNSTILTLSGTFAVPTNSSTNLVLDLYLPDQEGMTNGAQFDYPDFGGNGNGPSGWGFVQGKTYLGSYWIPNPASGAFSMDISGLGLAHGTAVTAAITYSSFARPAFTNINRLGNVTTLAWSGDNGGPYITNTVGGPSSGFGFQTGTNLSGPWTTSYAPTNTITVTNTPSVMFYRIAAPVSGMTTLCAPPVTLP